jgi:hypothetical protein
MFTFLRPAKKQKQAAMNLDLTLLSIAAILFLSPLQAFWAAR